MTLNYTILSCTSKDSKAIKELAGEEVSQREGNQVCWITARNHSFPQSLVIQLEQESYVGSVQVIAHPELIPSSCTLALGLPHSRFSAHSPASSNADYSQSFNFDFKVSTERLIACGGNALFIRLSVHGFVDSQSNPHRQIGILSLIVSGSFIGPTSSHSAPQLSKSPRASSSRSRTSSPIYSRTPSELNLPIYTSTPPSRDLHTLFPSKRRSRTPSPQQRPKKKMDFAKSSDSEDEHLVVTNNIVKRLNQNKKLNDKDDEEEEREKKEKEMEELQRKNDEAVLTPRTKEKILADIRGYGDGQNVDLSDLGLGGPKDTKKHFFSKRMTEFNTMLRAFEVKKEEAVWREQYEKAQSLEEAIKRLREREAGLRELLVERADALDKNDYAAAQRAKNRFETNINDALHSVSLQKHFSEDEMTRMKGGK